MLTDKQVFCTGSDARLIFLLDADSLNGNAEVVDPLQQRAMQLLLGYNNAPQACFVQLASGPSLLIPGIFSLELRKSDQGISSFHCDWNEGSSSEWLLQTSAVSLRERLLSEKSQFWTALPTPERTWLATLIIAATKIENTPRKSTRDNASLPCLLVTTNPQLLDQQLQLQKIANNAVLRIVTPAEAARILDLWLKLHDRYLLKPDFSCGEYEWYSVAAISDLSRAAGEDPLQRSLIRRMAAIRYGVDMLGRTYYWHLVGDAMAQQEYHFLSTIMLLTALLDTLAIVVNHTLQHPLKESTVNLSPRNDADLSLFRKAVQCELPRVDDLWKCSGPFLQLLYHVIRNPLAHQKTPAQFAYYYVPMDTGQAACTVKVTSTGTNVRKLRTQCGEVPLPHEHYTSLGFSREDPHGIFDGSQQLEPYLFCRETWSRCKALVNATLELLGYPDVLTSINAGTGSPKERAIMFRQTALDGLDLTTSEYSETGIDRRN